MNSQIKNKLIKYVPVILSLIALVVSIMSYRQSQSIHNYNVQHDMLFDTPSLTENVDSTQTIWGLNKDGAELQYMRVWLPSKLSELPIDVMTKPLIIQRHNLEPIARRYVKANIIGNDSMAIVGELALPTVIDYSAIISGFPYTLREFRNLIFRYFVEGNATSVTYCNSILIGKCTFPLIDHSSVINRIVPMTKERIQELDKIDIEELLDNELEKQSLDIRAKLNE